MLTLICHTNRISSILIHFISRSLAVKPGVLRFGPPPVAEMDLCRIPASGLPPTAISAAPANTNTLRPQPNANINPTTAGSPTIGGVAPLPAQSLPLNKTVKKPRKEGEPERDVQSPAYSDISDDSTPVDSDAGGRFYNPFLRSLIYKSSITYRISQAESGEHDRTTQKELAQIFVHTFSSFGNVWLPTFCSRCSKKVEIESKTQPKFEIFRIL